jgi:hypothetical protein
MTPVCHGGMESQLRSVSSCTTHKIPCNLLTLKIITEFKTLATGTYPEPAYSRPQSAVLSFFVIQVRCWRMNLIAALNKHGLKLNGVKNEQIYSNL